MKLVVLNDNEPSPGFLNDWGWSVLVEGRYRFLFDADTRGEVLLHNAHTLGVSLEGLDFAFHWHYDHYGGFPTVGELNPGLKLFAPPGSARKLGRLSIVEVATPGELLPGVWTSGPIGSFEQALGVETPSGLVVMVGCSHPGADRLTEYLLRVSGYKRAYLVVGGFHYPRRRTLDRLAEMAEFIAPAHCSGNDAKAYVLNKYPEKFVSVRTGTVLEL